MPQHWSLRYVLSSAFLGARPQLLFSLGAEHLLFFQLFGHLLLLLLQPSHISCGRCGAGLDGGQPGSGCRDGVSHLRAEVLLPIDQFVEFRIRNEQEIVMSWGYRNWGRTPPEVSFLHQPPACFDSRPNFIKS